MTLFFSCVALFSCGEPGLNEIKEGVKTSLSTSSFAQARADCESVLTHNKAAMSRADRWAFEDLRLQAVARSGDGAESVATLGRLAGEYASQITPAYYVKITSYVRDGGDLLGAVDLLAAGAERFPADKSKFDALAEALKEAASSAGDSEALEKLKSLGYV